MKINNPEQKNFYADFFNKIFLGLIIGVASITPGLSGGVIAAVAGLYEPAVRAIVNIRKEFRRSVLFLLPLGIGAGAGGFLFSGIMQKLMAFAEIVVLYVFLGLVAGSMPALVKEANGGKFKPKYLLVSAVALALVIFLEQLPAQQNEVKLGVVNTLLCGAVLAVGTIIPGISSSFLLMYFGVYEKLLPAITGFDLKILFLLAAGFGITALLIIKLVEVLFRKFHSYSYYTVIGFLLGSMIMVFPGFRTGWSLAGDLFSFCLSAALSFFVIYLNGKAHKKA